VPIPLDDELVDDDECPFIIQAESPNQKKTI